MNIINHLHDKVTEIVSPNQSQNEAELLEKFYSIVLMRMTDSNAYNELTQDDSRDSDDLTLYELLHSTTWNSEQTADILIENLADNHDVDEDTVERLLIDSTPLIFAQIRLLADNQPVPQYLQGLSHKSEDSFIHFIPLWALNVLPSGIVPEGRVKEDPAQQDKPTEKSSTASVVGSAAAALAAAFGGKKAVASDNSEQNDNNKDADAVIVDDNQSVDNNQVTETDVNMQDDEDIVVSDIYEEENSSYDEQVVTEEYSEYSTARDNHTTDGFDNQHSNVEYDNEEYYIDDSQDYLEVDDYDEELADRMSIPLPEPVHADASDRRYRYSSLVEEEYEQEAYHQQAQPEYHQPAVQEEYHYTQVDPEYQPQVQQDTSYENVQENVQQEYQDNSQVAPVIQQPSLDQFPRPIPPKRKSGIMPFIIGVALLGAIIWGVRSCGEQEAGVDAEAQEVVAENADSESQEQTLIKISTDKKGQIEQLDLIADSTETSNKVKQTLEKTFGVPAQVNEIKVDPSYQAPALSYAKLTELFSLMIGLPNSTLSVSGKVIHFSTANKSKHKMLVDEAQNIVSDFSITTDDNDETESKAKPDDKKNSKVVKLPSSKDDTALVKSKDDSKNLDIDKEVKQSIAESNAQLAKLNEKSDIKDIEKVLNTQIMNFAVNGDDIPQANKEILDKVVELLKKRNAYIRITGYTDSSGDEDYNKRLSEDRSYAVKKYLMSQGIISKRIKADGAGEADPVASNDTEEGRFQNRRIEFVVYEAK